MTNAQILGELYKLLPEVERKYGYFALHLAVYDDGSGSIRDGKRCLCEWRSLTSALPAVRKYLKGKP